MEWSSLGMIARFDKIYSLIFPRNFGSVVRSAAEHLQRKRLQGRQSGLRPTGNLSRRISVTILRRLLKEKGMKSKNTVVKILLIHVC